MRVVASVLWFVGCASESTEPPEPPAPDTSGVACGVELPGPPMDAVIESAPDYAERLDAVDLSGLPATIDLSHESDFTQAVVGYMLNQKNVRRLDRDALLERPMGRAVLAAVAQTDEETGTLDFVLLREGLHAFYACDRGYPATIEGFNHLYGDYTTWPKHRIRESVPKDKDRIIYVRPDGDAYAAETMAGGNVREVEIVLRGQRDDGALDFLAYTTEGELTDRSTFAMGPTGRVTSSSPYTCLACHLDGEKMTFTEVHPEM